MGEFGFAVLSALQVVGHTNSADDIFLDIATAKSTEIFMFYLALQNEYSDRKRYLPTTP